MSVFSVPIVVVVLDWVSRRFARMEEAWMEKANGGGSFVPPEKRTRTTDDGEDEEDARHIQTLGWTMLD